MKGLANTRILRLPLWSYILIGALVRIGVALTTTNFGDVGLYASMTLFGSLHFPVYRETLFTYPPLLGYYFLALGRFCALLGIQIFQYDDALLPYQVRTLITSALVTPQAMLLLKLPALALDALVTWQLVRFLAPVRVRLQQKALLLLAWWLNPAVIFTSSVQAGWDSAVVAAALGCALAIRRRRSLEAGVWLALGAAAKLLPVLLVPVALAGIVRGKQASVAVRGASAFWLGFGLTIALLSLPILVWHETASMRDSILARGGMPTFGGFSLLSLSAIGDCIRTVLLAHLDAVTGLSLALGVTTVAVFSLYAWRSRAEPGLTVAVASTAILLGALAFSPFVQPTYYVWIAAGLPLCVAFSRGVGRTLLAASAWVSATSAFLFLATIRLPQALFLPACYFLHLCDAAALARQDLAYNTLPGRFTPLLQVDIDTTFGVIGGAALLCALATLVVCVSSKKVYPTMRATRPEAAHPSLPSGSLTLLSAATLVVVFAALSPLPPPASISISRNGGRYTVRTRGYNGIVLSLATTAAPRVRSVAVYDDPLYAAGRGFTRIFAYGFPIHLHAALQAYSFEIPVVRLDASRLAAYLKRAPGTGSALCIFQGTLPDVVTGSALRRWVYRGGILFWSGEPLGGFRAGPGIAIPTAVQEQPYQGAWHDFYRDGVLDPAWELRYQPFREGFGSTPGAEAAMIRATATTFGVPVRRLRAHGGWPIGFQDRAGRTSVAVLPIGRGRIVLYGDGQDYEVAAAREVARILVLGLWYRPIRSVSDVMMRASSRAFQAPGTPGGTVFAYGRNPLGLPFAAVPP